jgi:hypothetical protein
MKFRIKQFSPGSYSFRRPSCKHMRYKQVTDSTCTLFAELKFIRASMALFLELLLTVSVR